MKHFLFILLIGSSLLRSQSILQDSIYLTTADTSDKFNFDIKGLKVGENIPDLLLYDKIGAPVRLQSLLDESKPLLLVSGSITCNVFRRSIDSLRRYDSLFGSRMKIVVVYTIEAHPAAPDVCPYTCKNWTMEENSDAGIIFDQPQTMKERIALAEKMITKCNLKLPVLIDGPENLWWKTFGPAPNNAYLIMPDKRIALKYGWLTDKKNNCRADFERLLF